MSSQNGKSSIKSDVESASRYGPLFAGLLALPYGCWLAILVVPVILMVSLGFWVLFFTGRYPDSFFNLGIKYFTRLRAYSLRLINEYPPFSGNKISSIEETSGK